MNRIDVAIHRGLWCAVASRSFICLLSLLLGTWVRGQETLIDESFDPGLPFEKIVRGSVVQPDGKILIVGNFTNIHGVFRGGIARLEADGSLDHSFDPGTVVAASPGIILQPDGKVILRAAFPADAGVIRTRVGRLNPDGSVDEQFKPQLLIPGTDTQLEADSVHQFALQPDGKLLVMASTSVLQPEGTFLLRFHTDGTRDTLFKTPQVLGLNLVKALSIQPNGGILVAPSPRTRFDETLIRFHEDGSSDTSFNAEIEDGVDVTAIAIQPDGKILVGGGSTDNRPVHRLNADGSRDPGFYRALFAGIPPFGIDVNFPLAIDVMALQPDGRVVVAGRFESVDGVERRGLARLNPDGTLDAGFYGGALHGGFLGFPFLYGLTIQPDGKILLGGLFTVFGTDVLGSGFVRYHPGPAIGRPVFHFAFGGSFVHPQFIQEGGDPLALTVLRSGRTNEAVSIGVITRNGTARAGSDFAPVATRLEFASGETNKTIEITASSDREFEETEDFFLALTDPSPGAGLGGPNVTRINLQDGNVKIQFEETNHVISELEREITVTVWLLRTSYYNYTPGPAGVDLSAEGSTATLGKDFRADLGTLDVSNAVNSTYWTVKIQVIDDEEAEGDETIQLTLANPTGRAVLGSATNLVFTIRDNDTPVSHGRGVDGPVYCAALEPGGTIIIGGEFSVVDAQPRIRVARLRPDLSLDDSFNAGVGPDATVYAVAMQNDGKAVIGGSFISVAGVPRRGVARLNVNGSVDLSFDPKRGLELDGGFAGSVRSIVIQPDGRILVGGRFTTVDGILQQAMARFEPDGRRDESFGPLIVGSQSSGWQPEVWSIGLQTNGDIVITGDFYCVNDLTVQSFAWLDRSGRTTTNVNPESMLGGRITLAVPQPDGKFIVGGQWTDASVGARRLARLSSDGSLDATYAAGLEGLSFFGLSPAVALQPDDKLLLIASESFSTAALRLFRFETNGSKDATFDGRLNADGAVESVLALRDGRLFLGGSFSQIDGAARYRIAQLSRDGRLINPARIERLQRDPDGTARVAASAQDSVRLLLETSEDLREWFLLSTNTVPAKYSEFVDTNAIGHVRRFYRVRASE